MNCCDDYGDCRQGRDCPVRKEITPQPSPSIRYQRSRLKYWLVMYIAGVIWVGGFVALMIF